MHNIMSSVPRNGGWGEGRDREEEEEEEKTEEEEKEKGGDEGLKSFKSQFASNWQHPPSMVAVD